MIRHTLSTILLGSLLLSGAAAQAETGLSLPELYQAALKHDARFNAAIADRDAGQQQLPIARSQLLPDIALTGNLAYNRQDTEYSGSVPFSSGQRDFSSRSVGVKLVQPVYRKDRYESYRQAEVAISQADTRLTSARQQLILDVSSAYFDVLLAQEGLKLAAAEKAANTEQLARAQRGFEVGSAAITDVHEAQARYDLAVSEAIDANQQVQLARRQLTTLSGIAVQDLPLPERRLPPPLSPQDMQAWSDRAGSGNLAVRQAEQTLQIARHEIERVRGAAYPKLDVVLKYDNNHADDSNLGTGIDSAESKLMLEATVPLYSGGLVSAGLKQKRAEYRSAQLQLEAARRDARLQAEQAYLACDSGVHRIAALQQALVSSQTALTSSQRGFEIGLSTGSDVLDAQRQLFAARQKLAEAHYTYLLDRLRLEAATGQLDERNIRDITASAD